MKAMRSRNTRLSVLSACAIGVAALAGGLGGVAPAAAQTTLTVVSYGGGYQEAQDKAFFTPFAEANPSITIRQDSPSSNAKLKAMVESGNVTWDVVLVDDSFGLDTDAAWLEPIDYSIVKADHLEPYWRTEYGVYTSTGASVIAYNTKAFPASSEPKSWKDFWNVKDFPGPRSLYSRFYYNYEAALRAADVPADEIYPATDEKVKLALEKLAEIKPHVSVWWTAGAQPPQLLATGEVVMALAWSGRIFDAMKESDNVAMTFKDAIAWGNAYIVPKGTPYRDLAMEIINYCITQEAQERLLPIGTYGPALGAAAAKATPEQAKSIVTYPDNIKDAVIFNDEQVAIYATKWEEEWQKFQLG